MNLIDSLAQSVRKHMPEILVAVGITGVVAGTVVACKETKKVDPILDEHNKQMEAIHMAADMEVTADGQKYDEKDKRKDTAITYAKTGFKLVKVYAPAALIIGGSIGCILGSHKILTKRNIGLTAAYTGLSQTFEDYRKKIIDKYGPEADVEARYEVKAKKKKGKDGEPDKVIYEPVGDIRASDHARFFQSDSGYFDKSKITNLSTLFSAERNLNRKLKTRRSHTVSLNEVYDALDLEPSKDALVLGYKYVPGKDPVDEDGVPQVIKFIYWVFDDKVNKNVKRSIEDEMLSTTNSEPVMLIDFPGLVPIV